jgi:hypothetical protein
MPSLMIASKNFGKRNLSEEDYRTGAWIASQSLPSGHLHGPLARNDGRRSNGVVNSDLA